MFLLISCVFLNILNTLSNKRDNQLCVILISIFYLFLFCFAIIRHCYGPSLSLSLSLEGACVGARLGSLKREF